MSDRRTWASVTFLFILAGVVWFFSTNILLAAGRVLTVSEEPRAAEMIVVIGGDSRGNRILEAAELAREGYAPRVLVSGIGGMYGFYESELAVEFAVNHGYARELFVPLHYAAQSTSDEAQAIVPDLRRRGVHRYLLVTSEFHSARALRVFRRAGPDLEVHSVPAQDAYWRGGEWWKSREGRKTWLNEVAKTVADFFRI